MEQPTWLATNFTEPRVSLAIRDFCKPGHTVFDVGANFGGLTMMMSRVVGPRGAVCGFEANPSIAQRCQSALIAGGCGNAQLYHGAVFKVSGDTIKLYLSDNQVADSIYLDSSRGSIDVGTIALDDFVAGTDLVPSFVKMDIEGAEFDALIGFQKTLASHRPTLVLEQSPADDRCLRLLRDAGYAAVDLSTYAVLETMDDVVPETVITDILFASPALLERHNYLWGTAKVADLTRQDFKQTSARALLTGPLNLEPGRYVVSAEFSSREEDSKEVFCGAWMAGEHSPLMQHHGQSASLGKLAHRWVFQTKRPAVSLFLDFPDGIPESLTIGAVSVSRVNGIKPRSLDLA